MAPRTLTRYPKPRSYLLVRHPTVLDRLRFEIKSIVGNDPDLTRAQVFQMPYLKCILNESQSSRFTSLSN